MIFIYEDVRLPAIVHRIFHSKVLVILGGNGDSCGSAGCGGWLAPLLLYRDVCPSVKIDIRILSIYQGMVKVNF